MKKPLRSQLIHEQGTQKYKIKGVSNTVQWTQWDHMNALKAKFSLNTIWKDAVGKAGLMSLLGFCCCCF